MKRLGKHFFGRVRTMSRSLLALACLALATPDAPALDSNLSKPYTLKVVVRVADHPLLTRVFKDQVRQRLRDGLQAALDDLAEVSVVDQHPWLADVEAKGLQQALDERAGKELNGVKTHFVLIDSAEGQYTVRARQYDGDTGLPSPVVRQGRTWDRLLVARTAGMMIARDFGAVGTVAEKLPDGRVRLELRGGKLGAPPEGGVKKDEVFAVAQLDRGPRGLWSFRVPWALLQVLEEPKDGACLCRLLKRYEDPPSNLAAGVGYRCLKLGTAAAP